METKLKSSDTLLSTYLNNTPNIAWIVDEDEKLVFANESFFRYMNNDKTSLGKTLFDVVPPLIAASLVNNHKKILETDLPQHIQEKMFLADGSEMIFWIILFPIDNLNGKKRIGGEAINITRQMKDEQPFQNTSEQLLLLNRVTKDAIWEWDLRTGIFFRNQSLKDMIGFAQNNTQNLSWWFRRIHDEDRRKVKDNIKNVIERKGQSWESEYRFKKSSGEYIIVIDQGFVIYENELPVKMIGSLHDITQIKELEVKLTQEKIQRQKDITETIFKVQEKERTRIGHELHDNVNQILGAAKLFVEMLGTHSDEEKDIKEKTKEYLLSAIEEIRKLSKEMVTPQLKENGLIASINTLVEDLNTANVMNVFFNHQGNVENISSSKKVTLFRITQEQIKNTLKYSGANNLSISLETKNNNVLLVIEDDGKGFDPGQTRRGIGLSNIYERTRFYNGTVMLKTTPGSGCRLSVRIPLEN
ncbi:MAG: PAS domain-containing protein [Sphingobacteriales bacterium]